MTPQRRRRLYAIGVMVAGVAIAATLVGIAFRENLLFFFSPTQIANGEAPIEQTFRVGGLVVPGSAARPEGDDVDVRFELTDKAHSVPVQFNGLLPDLFREGQGIVAKGRLTKQGVFVADEVLAKHDENYMPPEVAEALMASGADNPHDGEAQAGYGVERK